MKLSCLWVKRKLSRYADGELSGRGAATVGKHLSACPACQRRLEEVQQPGRLLLQMPAPKPAPDLWAKVQKRAGAISAAEENRPGNSVLWPLRPAKVISVAAVVVFLLLIVVLFPELNIFRDTPLVVNHAAALDLGLYLDGLEEGPLSRHFEQKHKAVLVSPEEARRKCHFPVLLPPSLPDGYRLTGTKLLTSICCFAAWAQYRKDDTVVEIFELPPRHPISFGDRKAIEEITNGIQYSQIQAEKYKVVHWAGSGVNVTLVGNVPEEELKHILKYLARQ